MLCLTRNPDESIIINGNVIVKVVSVSGKSVKLGIEAPEDITVHREEIQKKIDAQQGEDND